MKLLVRFAVRSFVMLVLLVVAIALRPAPTATAMDGQYRGLRLPCLLNEACAVTRGGQAHAGQDRHAVDFDLRYRDFPAIRGGRVVFAGWKNNDLGYQLWVDHEDNYCSIYAHLAGQDQIYVTAGAYVAQGQIVAQSGNSGNSTGPHLHIVVTQKSGGECTDAQANEIAMYFDEQSDRELVGGDAPVSQNTLTFFADVHGSYWSRKWSERLYHDRITTGCAQNPLRFCPEQAVTRAQMAIFLLRVKHGSDYQPPAATGLFDDVRQGAWAREWIEQLYREGITTGCAQNPLRYCPEQVVTRGQMSIFLLRVKHGSDFQP